MDEHQQHEFKIVKRRLSAIQTTIKNDLHEGRHPQSRDVADFVAASREMENRCMGEWRAAMSAYMERLEQFQADVARGHIQDVSDSFQKLLDSKISCHKAFR